MGTFILSELHARGLGLVHGVHVRYFYEPHLVSAGLCTMEEPGLDRCMRGMVGYFLPVIRCCEIWSVTHVELTIILFFSFLVHHSLVLQFAFCVISLFRGPHRVQDVPWWLFVLSFLWPVVFLPVQELVKARDLKECVRAQKLAKLEFNTKLGMHSPL